MSRKPKPQPTDGEMDHSLLYTTPAQDWEREALPIGNGRLGAMIFGGLEKERIQFNVDSLWFGDEENTGSFQPFGDVHIALGHKNAEAYRRELDIQNALHRVTYQCNGVQYIRESFSSYPAQVMVFRLFADQSGAYTGTIILEDAHKAKVTADGSRITCSGSLAGSVYQGSGTYQKDVYSFYLDYEAQLFVQHEGGTLTALDGSVSFEDCDSLTILLAADTNYLNRRDQGWRGPHPHERISAQITAAAGKSYAALKGEHIRDYLCLFDRFAIDLGQTSAAVRQLDTSERLQRCKEGSRDPGLEVLVFDYARYLMISSSRPGSLPSNLQGIWNDSESPAWHSDYHTNINIQMNYWFVESTNLSECFLPFAEWVHAGREVWKERTKITYNARGWVLYPSNGIFGGCTTWAWSKGDSAWLAQSLYDHYAHTLDETYLRTRAYPVMKDVCEFWEDHLKELADGTLVAPDGFSPEHGPREDGVSFDQQLVWDLFTNFIEASEVLGEDEAFRQKVASMRGRLLGPRIGQWGQLQEWMVDRDEQTDQHRHVAHMIAVHPGRQISPLTTPEYAKAAAISMNARGDGGTGWSKAWKISIWARLHDGDRAYKMLTEMLRGNLHDNLFDFHPPFQIDGNFGYAAGVCEMLLQSHAGCISLLPALPSAWPTGRVTGLRARGGFTVDVSWSGGRLDQATIRGTRPGAVELRYAGRSRMVSIDESHAATVGAAAFKSVNRDKRERSSTNRRIQE